MEFICLPPIYGIEATGQTENKHHKNRFNPRTLQLQTNKQGSLTPKEGNIILLFVFVLIFPYCSLDMVFIHKKKKIKEYLLSKYSVKFTKNSLGKLLQSNVANE